MIHTTKWLKSFAELMDRHYDRRLWDQNTTSDFVVSAHYSELSPGEAVNYLVNLIDDFLYPGYHDLSPEFKRRLHAYQ